MMAYVEMEAMEKFPIEKLSYDLKLELLENMDPRDVVELVNVNQGFRSIVVREPWRTFGKHVYYISAGVPIWDQNRGIEIGKFGSSIVMGRDNLIFLQLSDGSSSHLMKHKSFSNLISKIRSCQILNLEGREDQAQEAAQLSAELLGNLNSVSELRISIYDAKGDIEKFLTYLTLNYFKRADLYIRIAERNEQMLGLLSDFVEKRLNHSMSIQIHDLSRHCSFWYEPLSKIWTEMILLHRSDDNGMDFAGLVHRIVAKGIPSLNPEAAILLSVAQPSGNAENTITSLLSRTPGVCQIARKDRGEVQVIWEKLLLDELIPENRRDLVNYLRKGVYFTRSIDSNRKCFYATDRYESRFFAKYITIG